MRLLVYFFSLLRCTFVIFVTAEVRCKGPDLRMQYLTMKVGTEGGKALLSFNKKLPSVSGPSLRFPFWDTHRKRPNDQIWPHGPLPMRPISYACMHAAQLWESRANDAECGVFLGPLSSRNL